MLCWDALFCGSWNNCYMRKLWILAPLFGVLLSTCSNEFEIAAPWKSIPVIYAMLSPKDTAHYVRIEKAFLDPTVSALVVAEPWFNLLSRRSNCRLPPEGGRCSALQNVSGEWRRWRYRARFGHFCQQPQLLIQDSPERNPGGFKGRRHLSHCIGAPGRQPYGDRGNNFARPSWLPSLTLRLFLQKFNLKKPRHHGWMAYRREWPVFQHRFAHPLPWRGCEWRCDQPGYHWLGCSQKC